MELHKQAFLTKRVSDHEAQLQQVMDAKLCCVIRPHCYGNQCEIYVVNHTVVNEAYVQYSWESLQATATLISEKCPEGLYTHVWIQWTLQIPDIYT